MRLSYILEEAMANLRYGGFINVLSLAIIALTIMILSAFILVVISIHGELVRLQQEPAIVVFLNDSVDTSSAHQLQRQFEKLNHVRNVRYVSKQEALNRTYEIFGQGAEAIIEGFEAMNPLPASLEIQMDTTDLKHIESLAEELRSYPGVEDVRYERSSTLFIRKAQLVLIGLSILLGSASVVIVWFSIMLTAHFRREEIWVMRMVGATYWFIRLPLILTGAMLGFFGSLLGLLAFYGLFRLFTAQLGDVAFLSTRWVFLILALGCFLGVIGGIAPVRRYVNA